MVQKKFPNHISMNIPQNIKNDILFIRSEINNEK